MLLPSQPFRRRPSRPVLGSTVLAAAAVVLAACGGAQDRRGAESTAAAGARATPQAAAERDEGTEMKGMEGMEMEVPTGPVAATTGPDIFATCAACHGQTGQGITGDGPPLAGSEWVLGNPEIPIRIILKGLQGPLTVKGLKYNASMPPLGGVLSDAQIAAVLTYERSSWGNRASPVTAQQVAAVRAAMVSRTTQWTAEELQPLQTPK